jgi:hypothetical protein
MFLNNNEQHLKVWNLCSSATIVTFPKVFSDPSLNRYFSVEAVKSICLNDRIKEIVFEGSENNICNHLKDKVGLIKAKFETFNDTYDEIMHFINNKRFRITVILNVHMRN